MTRVRILREAQRDLDAHWHFLADNSGSTRAADDWVDDIIQQISGFDIAPQWGVVAASS